MLTPFHFLIEIILSPAEAIGNQFLWIDGETTKRRKDEFHRWFVNCRALRNVMSSAAADCDILRQKAT